MKRMIALLLLLCMLTACAAPVPETEEPTAASQEIAVPEQKQPDSGTMTGAATFTQAASEPLTYTVVLKTLEDSAAAADGTTLAVRSYELPEMTVTLPDGTVLTEAASPAETAAIQPSKSCLSPCVSSTSAASLPYYQYNAASPSIVGCLANLFSTRGPQLMG